MNNLPFDVHLVNFKSSGSLFQIFVAFSECPNFNIRVSIKLLIYCLKSAGDISYLIKRKFSVKLTTGWCSDDHDG